VPEAAADISALLHKRLRLGGLLVSALFTFYTVVSVRRTFVNPDYFRENWIHFTFLWLVLLGSVVLTGMLWRQRPRSLGRLRLIEFALLGIVLTHMAWILFYDLVVAHRLAQFYEMARSAEEAEDLLNLYASTWSLGCLVVIGGYATLIPSGWKRCTLVVATLALVPLTTITLGGLLTLPSASSVPFCLVGPMALYLGIAVAIAAYGTHRMEMLRREAAEARKLGQYQLKQRLGAGGMGEVYLAEHMLLKLPCAIKLIRAERAGDMATLRRFEREVQATARLKHWNTVQIYDYGHTQDGTFSYVMEYLPGVTLEQLVKRHGPVLPARAVYLLGQVCLALREAHGLGLIHRDVKPANLLVCERGGLHDVVKVLDFGLVKGIGLGSDEERLTLEGTIAGTPAYMSPEQANGQDSVDARSDIYRLGAVAYFLLTGQPPFGKERPIQMILAHLHEPARPLADLEPEVPGDLQEIVLRCLEKDPARRFPDVASLHEAFLACRCSSGWSEDLATDWWRMQVSRSEERRPKDEANAAESPSTPQPNACSGDRRPLP
jgi:serine/threonine-protein kinase